MPFGSSRSFRAAAYHYNSVDFCVSEDEGDSTARELFGSTNFGFREESALPVAADNGVVRSRPSFRSSSLRTSGTANSINNDGSSAFEPRVSNTVSAKAASLIRELNNLDFASIGLVGRGKELEMTMAAYHEAMHSSGEKKDGEQRPLNLLLVEGRSGTGKSALVQEFGRKLIQQENFKRPNSLLWVSGKHEQHATRPYAAFTPAFVQLVAKIKSQEEDVGVDTPEDVRHAIGKDYKRLKKLIPNIRDLFPDAEGGMGASSSDASISSSRHSSQSSHQSAHPQLDESDQSFHIVKSQKRFIFLLIRLLAAVCRRQKLVIVLEDVQWIDPASLDLLETLLLDPSLKESILFICPYRENDVDNEHPFRKRLKSIQDKRKQQAFCVEIHNLSEEKVHDFLTELLNAPDPDVTLELAKIAHNKTNGNIFHLIQFVTALRDHQLIAMNLGTLQWTWDTAVIRSSTVVSDNVLAILLKRMKRLPVQHKHLIMLGACLGMTLDRVVLDLLVQAIEVPSRGEDCDLLSTQEALDDVVAWGLLEALPQNTFGNACYCFAHDQVQLAAISLLEEATESTPQLHLDMGKILYHARNQKTFDYADLLFTVVDFWNEGKHFINNNDEDVKILIQLNHQAGLKALESSAFEAAIKYLRTALDCLPNQFKSRLWLELFNLLLKAEYCGGDWEHLEQDIEIVLNQKHLPIEDKSVAYRTKIAMLAMNEHNHPAAISLAVDVLGQLGVVFRPKMALLGMIGGLLKTKRLLSKHPLEELMDHHEMTDPKRLLALDVIASMNSSLYAASPELLMCTVFKTLRWSFKYGVSKYTAKCLGMLGLVEMAMGNCKSATHACKVAEKLAEKHGVIDSENSPIASVYGFVLPWTSSLHSCSVEVLRGYKAGINSGDLEYAFINMAVFVFFGYSCGKPLSSLEADMRDYGFQMKQNNMSLQLQFLSLTWQTVLNLMGRNDNPLELTGEVMCQEEMLKAADDDKNPPLRSQVQCHRLQLAVYFGDFELAAKLIGPASNIGTVNPGNPIIWRTWLFIGVAAFEMVQRGKASWKRTANIALRRVKKWVEEGNVNCVHIMLFLQAEKSAASGKKTEATRKLYDQAIITSTRNFFRNDAALACERCGTMLERANDMDWATDYFKKAYEGYSSMEAYGKLYQLNERSALRPALEIGAVESEGGAKRRLDESPTIGTGDTSVGVAGPFNKTGQAGHGC